MPKRNKPKDLPDTKAESKEKPAIAEEPDRFIQRATKTFGFIDALETALYDSSPNGVFVDLSSFLSESELEDFRKDLLPKWQKSLAGMDFNEFPKLALDWAGLNNYVTFYTRDAVNKNRLPPFVSRMVSLKLPSYNPESCNDSDIWKRTRNKWLDLIDKIRKANKSKLGGVMGKIAAAGQCPPQDVIKKIIMEAEQAVTQESGDANGQIGYHCFCGYVHSSNFRSLLCGGEKYILTLNESMGFELLHRRKLAGAPEVTLNELTEAMESKSNKPKIGELFRRSGLWADGIIMKNERRKGLYHLK